MCTLISATTPMKGLINTKKDQKKRAITNPNLIAFCERPSCHQSLNGHINHSSFIFRFQQELLQFHLQKFDKSSSY